MNLKTGDIIYNYETKKCKAVPEGIYSSKIVDIWDTGFMAEDENFPDIKLMYSKSKYGDKWGLSKDEVKKYEVEKLNKQIQKIQSKIKRIENM